jgi:hypothetical protein
LFSTSVSKEFVMKSFFAAMIAVVMLSLVHSAEAGPFCGILRRAATVVTAPVRTVRGNIQSRRAVRQTPPAAPVSPAACSRPESSAAVQPSEEKHPTLATEALMDVVYAMHGKSNEIRAKHKLPLHPLHPKLCAAAQEQAEFLARTGHYAGGRINGGSGHMKNGDPNSRAAKYGFHARSLQEDLTPGRSVDEAFYAWVNAYGHHNYGTILSDTECAGFGFASGPWGNVYCALYGSE